MNSGLYAFAGASATATAAACAKRLDWPMTKLSNVYFGFRRVSLRETADAASDRLFDRADGCAARTPEPSIAPGWAR